MYDVVFTHMYLLTDLTGALRSGSDLTTWHIRRHYETSDDDHIDLELTRVQ